MWGGASPLPKTSLSTVWASARRESLRLLRKAQPYATAYNRSATYGSFTSRNECSTRTSCGRRVSNRRTSAFVARSRRNRLLVVKNQVRAVPANRTASPDMWLLSSGSPVLVFLRPRPVNEAVHG